MVALVQWVLLPLLAHLKKVVHSLDGVEDVHVRSAEEKRPFVEDIWFILWNLFPFAMLYFLFYLNQNWESWTHEFSHLVEGDLRTRLVPVDQGWGSASLTWALLAVSALSVWLQYRKQASFEDESIEEGKESIAYWWDRRISRRIFTIRAVALFFNMFLFLVALLNVFKCYHVAFVVSSYPVRPLFLHPDGMAGLGSLGLLCLSATLVLILVAGCGLVALIDHRGKQGFTHLVTDILLVGLVVPALILLVLPLQISHAKVLVEHQEMAADLAPQVQLMTEEIRGAAQQGDLKSEDLENIDTIASTASLIETPAFPIDFGMLVQMLSTFLLPALVSAKAVFGKHLGFEEEEQKEETPPDA
jgi:hypothetical protein